MATPTRTEYLAIDGLPLSTAAWETADIATILNGPEGRGSDLLAPGRRGQIARRRTLDSREIAIPMTVIGHYDSDGNSHADPRVGLIENLDELKKHLAPNYVTTEGTRTLTWTNGNGINRTADVHVIPALDVSSLGPTAARVLVRAVIPDGVLRDGAGSAYVAQGLGSSANTATFTVTTTGTGEIQDVEIYFAGQATWGSPSVLLTGTGAPAPGSGSTGDWYFDTAADELYGPRDSGGSWPGPIDYQDGTGAPSVLNIAGAARYVELVAGVPTNTYARTGVTNPDVDSWKLANLTFDATENTYVELDTAVAGYLTILCGDYYAKIGSTEVSGQVLSSGSPVWLPLLPGANTLKLTTTGNTVASALNVYHRGVYL